MGRELKEEITALVDNEIKDKSRIDELSTLIDNDEKLLLEQHVQHTVKSLCKERFASQKAPDYLSTSIKSKIRNSIKKHEEKKLSFVDKVIQSLRTPQFAFGLILIAAFVIFLSISSNKKSMQEIAKEQSGQSNMYVQANNNFNSILQGELGVQIQSSSPTEIKEFFKNSGVKYEASVPLFNDWNLLGAVVSEDKGEKLAHHVYAGDDGKILYLYQVDENYFTQNKILELTEDLMDYLEQGEYFKATEEGHMTYIWKNDHKIFTLVTNENVSKVENHFLTKLM